MMMEYLESGAPTESRIHEVLSAENQEKFDSFGACFLDVLSAVDMEYVRERLKTLAGEVEVHTAGWKPNVTREFGGDIEKAIECAERRLMEFASRDE